MLAAPEIGDEEIAHAERILLKPGRVFDEERRAFIRRLDTLDLQAVPGSGKTTALLAKLLILDRRLPFADGSGIAVLSHTNAALDEIKAKISHFCPRIFSYPSFVGTIQSFVDQFLAVPYYCIKNKNRPVRIHNELFNERALAFSKCHLADFTHQEANRAKYYLKAKENAAKIRFGFRDGKAVLLDGLNGSPLRVAKPFAKGPEWTDAECDRTLAWLMAFKMRLMKDGYLCFDDAYFLAGRYISVFPGVVDLLRRRFRHVFVDEMQDMGPHQHDLLESLFNGGPDAPCTYQRVGDRNQAIYHEGDDGDATDWVPRAPTLQLTNSIRLSAPIAKVVAPFALHTPDLKLAGLNQSTLSPTLLVYTDATALAVLKRFSALVRAQIDLGNIPFDAESRFRAVAWNTTWSGTGEKKPGKMRLVDFYPDYNRTKASKEPEPPSLAEWVRDTTGPDATMRSRENGLMGIFVKVLRAEGVRNPTFKIPFTRSSLLGYLKDKHTDYYATLRQQVYKWCLATANGEVEAVTKEVRAQVPKLLGKFNATCKETKDFVEGDGQAKPPKPKVEMGKPNTVSFDGFDIRLESVHAVKGQTHTATLYFESAFYGTGAKPKSYESQRLEHQFLGKGFPKDVKIRTRQSAKVVFVGFSRPTHFLCFAVHKDRFDEHLKDATQQGWAVDVVA